MILCVLGWGADGWVYFLVIGFGWRYGLWGEGLRDFGEVLDRREVWKPYGDWVYVF